MRAPDSWVLKIRRMFSESTVAGPLAVLIVIIILLSLFVPKFLSFRSITGIINAATLTGAIAIGIAFLMISGEFDLSVGTIMAVGGYLFGGLAMAGEPFLGFALALIVPTLLGVVNGVILVWTEIPSFIVTLGTKYFYRGMLWVVTAGTMLQTVDRQPIYNIFNGRLDLLNNIFSEANFRNSLIWLILLVIIFQVILARTKFGNHVFAVGSNAGAALGQGVKVKRVKIYSFAISGLMAGVTGILLFSQYYTMRVASGDGMELSAIAAAVVGGTLITGGAGSIWGALVGALVISTLRTGVVLMNIPFIPADNFEAIVGVTIVLAAILNTYLRNRK
ncbi:MAG: ABC transporter permease [Anaerolinea sp.]|nr:ABC transporter permease [Anaerolinea sp.]